MNRDSLSCLANLILEICLQSQDKPLTTRQCSRLLSIGWSASRMGTHRRKGLLSVRRILLFGLPGRIFIEGGRALTSI
jgi:hypothetical protein